MKHRIWIAVIAVLLITICIGTASYAQAKTEAEEPQAMTMEELREVIRAANVTDSVLAAMHQSGRFYEYLLELDKTERTALLECMDESTLAVYKETLKYEFMLSVISKHTEKISDQIFYLEAVIQKSGKFLINDAINDEINDEIVGRTLRIITSDIGEAEKNSVTDLNSYVEYLQGMTEMDLSELKDRMNGFEQAEELPLYTSDFEAYIYAVLDLGQPTGKATTITGIGEMDFEKSSQYKQLIIENSERGKLEEKMDLTVLVSTAGGVNCEVPVTWESEDDIETTNFDVYTYYLNLMEGYQYSKELQTAFDGGVLERPFYDVQIKAGADKDAETVTHQTAAYAGKAGEMVVLDSGLYFFRVSTKALALELAGGSGADGANIRLGSYNAASTQRWIVTKYTVDNKETGYYRIVNSITRKALDVSGALNEDRTNIQQYTWNASDAQLWKFIYAADGRVLIQSKLGKVMDVAEGNLTAGVNIQLFTANYSAAQQWTYTKITNTKVFLNPYANSDGTGDWPENPVKYMSSAYQRLQYCGGTIYVMNPWNIVTQVTLSNKLYVNGSTEISIYLGNEVKGMVRYVKPSAAQTPSGYNVSSYYADLFRINRDWKLTLTSLVFDGQRNEAGDRSNAYYTSGIKATGSLIYSDGGTLVASGCKFINNYKSADIADGGAIILAEKGNAVLTKCTIDNNRTHSTRKAVGGEVLNYALGGGIAVYGGKLTIKDSVVSNNYSDNSSGGGIFGYMDAVIESTNTEYRENKADYGGAIGTNPGNIVISGGKFENNSALYDGGTIHKNNAENGTAKILKISGAKFLGSYAKRNAGAVMCWGNNAVVIENSTFSGSKADENSGVVTIGGPSGVKYTPTIRAAGCGFADNTTVLDGGVFYVCNGAACDLTAYNSFERNISMSGNGGAIYNEGVLNIASGYIARNTAVNGGGVYMDSGVLNLSGGNIVSNIASSNGAGIYYGAGAVVNMNGNAQVNKNNDIYLAKEKFIYITGALTNVNQYAGNVTPSEYSLGRKIARVAYGGKNAGTEFQAADGTQKFSLTPKEAYLLRPGDQLESGSGIAKTDIIISRSYNISYEKNTDRAVTELPEAQNKFWKETLKLAAKVPQNKGMRFHGWGLTSGKKDADYQPSGTFVLNADTCLYAIWINEPPVIEITNKKKQNYYEGTAVTKADLLSEVKASDKEEGDLTQSLRIVQIKYADGKIVNDVKTKGKTDVWNLDMPEDYQLDTWFLQMDEKDSPVTHTVTFAVSDSAGATTTLDWKVQIKFNSFPVIDTPDKRYFTLKEAREGKISEKALLQDSMESGDLKVTDKEDDELYPGTISGKVKLIGFDPQEFKNFFDSGFVTVTYSVKDSMGPDGEGKETLRSIQVYVVKDGVVSEPESIQAVRFIDKENYNKNKDVDSEMLTEKEKDERNANGGLHILSNWYKNDTYKSLIESAFRKTSPDQTWVFDPEDVKKVKAYVEKHGIGNSRDGTGLSGFCTQFSDNRK